ncbi:LEAF RUST 10 DISEASE-RESISTANCEUS RECEPTOR-LIKE PROTEIN KINASE-like 2.1 [Coffea arabica]|uniref:non-specific serine/threonine protein kinase n=1 Tax=Coffea arabica TaxID=13443 RepID=A0A6P6XKU5_COFAR|nr:LEAF RUST 10 DISEASE-RESISTANCE LOCUS RECEPTOR-LIKE PROTEIN KINASE-like 2.1 [Coffea arabica]
MSIDHFHSSMTNSQLIFFILSVISFCYSAKGDQFKNCSLLYNCGTLMGIGYPFSGGDRPNYCGRRGFELSCANDQYTHIWFDLVAYRVLGIDPLVRKMTVARLDLWEDICPVSVNRIKDSTLSKLNPGSDRRFRNIHIFYGCTSEVIAKVQIQSNVSCSIFGENSGVFFAGEFVSSAPGCTTSMVVSIQFAAYIDLWDRKITLQQALKQGVDVEYDTLEACSSCEASGGKCGSDSTYEFICICQDQSHPKVCPKHGKGRWLKRMIGAIMAGIGILSCSVICYCYYKKYSKKTALFLFSRKTDDKELEAFLEEHGSLVPKRYSYTDIKKMTHYFKEKLGHGGYGEVYRGNLFDKRPVAIKVLSMTKGNGEEFINEVVSISKTSHVNVVNLVGFCLDGRKRALVYEFMPNGSLEKYIHHDSKSYLGLERLHEIAIGIGRGLEYLHGGCNTRILHLDIKPHNILLDEEYCPKISDFGLAKLCARNESVLSMSGARGTIGYIAPEVFSRNFGGVSYKSDVYSYGMMILEMAGGRKNAINVQLSNSSEAYFPDWLYDRVLIDEDLKLHGHTMTKEENDIARKMILVGLWCIQTNPSHRPKMSKVIDMLEGSLMSLEVPPKPFFSSPSRSEGGSLEMTLLPQTILPTSSSSPADSGTR